MKKYFFLLLLVSSCFMFGQDVTKQMAMEIATHYYERVKNDNMSERINIIKAENRECYGRSPELMSPLGLADMWLVPVDDGWVLVSTNTKTTPVLAHYQTSQKPIYDSLSPGEKYLLEWYEKSIAYANDSCQDCQRNWKWDSFQYDRATSAQMRTVPIVSPLLSTRWGQTRNNGYLPYDCDKCYNKFCPTIDNAPNQCDKAAVGCVAVAIGQIMAYWGWPYGAPVPTTSGGSTYDYQFYDWTLMPDWIYNSTSDNQVDMIAGFLRDCGYQASMSYGVSSGATDDSAKNALIAFGYDENTISLKAKWQTSGWQAMLFNELNAGRPVYYSGYSNFLGADGHAFVLDGYDSDGKFHINFGWRGSCDSFYQIDTIIPYNDINFNYWQSAIVGIQPAAVYCDSFTIYSYTMVPTKFCLAISGELVLNGKVLENVVRNELYSATQVRLMPGTTIREGSNVHIAIKDVPCQSRTNDVPDISAMREKKDNTTVPEQMNSTLFAISPNPVNSVLHIQTSDELSQVKVYTINGQCVLHTSQTDIDVSALPQGMYILRALNADGTIQQAKFIRE